MQVIFVLPNIYPVTYETLNYAPVAVGIVLFGALLTWVLPCGLGAKDWFRGEKHNLDPSVSNILFLLPQSWTVCSCQTNCAAAHVSGVIAVLAI